MKQYFDLLGIDETCSKDEVKKAFLSQKAQLQNMLLSKEPGERKEALQQLQELTKAYKEIIASINSKKVEVQEPESNNVIYDAPEKNASGNVNVEHVSQIENTVVNDGESSDDEISTNPSSLEEGIHPEDNFKICPKCKYANDSSLNFCGNCGQPLRNNDEDGVGDSGGDGVVTTIVKYKNYVFSVLAILLILVCGIGVFKNFVNTPEKVVEKYLTALGKQDYGTAYGYLFVTENDFVNKDNYIKSAEFVKKKPSAYKDKLVVQLSKGVIDINVVPMAEQSKIEGLTAYQYTLRLSDNSEIKGKLEVVAPISSWDKILNKYKILNNDLVSVQDIEVETNAKFYIDGVLMKNPTVTERGTHNYNARIFYGEHNIKVEAPFCDPYETKLILTPSTKSPILYYWKSHLKKDVLQDMEKQSEDIQRKIVEGAVKNEGLENLQLGFSEAKLNNMYDQYKRFFNRADGSGIYSMDITEVTSNEQYNNRLYNPFKNRIYKINFKFNYTRKNRNGIQESRVGNGEGELGVVFKLENDKVVPVAIDTFRLRTH